MTSLSEITTPHSRQSSCHQRFRLTGNPSSISTHLPAPMIGRCLMNVVFKL